MAFTIKELESLSGIKAHTIRIWEQRYNFLKPGRTSTNIRTYSNEELKTLLNVALLNRFGYKISRIDNMPEDLRTKAVLDLHHKEAQVEYILNQLIGKMIDLKAIEFERTLNDFIEEHGLMQSIESVIFPFLEKVGLLWQSNNLMPVQEHIVSGLIRQKIISGIDGLPQPMRTKPLFILFLPEYEYHELGLLFVNFLLKKQRVPVLYLGANVPLKDICYVTEIKQPATLYTHLTTAPRKVQFEKFLKQLSDKTLNSKIILSGNLTTYTGSLPTNALVLKSLQEVSSYLSTY